MKNPKYYFYSNPNDFYKWTKCPKCDHKTKVRKFCLMIHYEDKAINFHQLFSLNKSCKLCPQCDLIIGQKTEIDQLLQQILSSPSFNLQLNPNGYFVFGTMKKKDWLKSQKDKTSQKNSLSLVHPFTDTLDFEIQPAGWYPA